MSSDGGMLTVCFSPAALKYEKSLLRLSFPLMNGSYFPPGIELQSPFLSNFIDHPAIVQFIHRNIAYFLGLLIVVQLYIRRSEIRSAKPRADQEDCSFDTSCNRSLDPDRSR